MSNDRFSTRVYDTHEKRMLYQGCDYLGIDNTSIIDFDDGFECIKYIDFGTRFIPMQCTGGKDKTKKLAYESDIFRKESYNGVWRYGIIEWAEDDDCMFLNSLEKYDYDNNFRYDFHDSMMQDLEIIGNIHQHKELLEVDK